MEVKIGDVVKLKSGSPEMTVTQYPFKTMDGVECPDMVMCTWFNADNHLKHAVFKVEELIKF